MSMRYTVVILDIDGTIVDSNDAHAQAWVKALARHGHTVDFSAVRTRIGMGGDKLLTQVADVDVESPEGRSISASRQSIFAAEYLPHLKPTHGARRMVAWLKQRGTAIAIATSAKAEEVNGLLEAAGVSDLIDRIASSDDAAASKPDPDIVVAALKKSGKPKDQAIMIGDTPYDIQAATAAGIPTIAFRSGGWSDPDLAEAVAIYDDPDDLVTNQAGSPLDPGGRA
jgi:HAD superfamily hydrolase (TIGR01509 family)